MNKLTAKIEAVNTANACANKLYDALSAFFIPLIGEKILKADGNLLERYNKIPIPSWETLSIGVRNLSSKYTLMWGIHANSPVPHASFTTYIHLGEIQDGKLVKINPKPKLVSDYTVGEVLNRMEVLRLAQRMVVQAKDNLLPFDEELDFLNLQA